MSARADLTGQQFGEWHVKCKAPAQARKPFWTVTHGCGATVDLAHTLLVSASKGTATALPPCVACSPAEQVPAVSHGMHLACGQAHLTGTPCGSPLVKVADGDGVAYVHGHWPKPCPVDGPPSMQAPGHLVGVWEGEARCNGDHLPALDLDGFLDDDEPRELDLDALDLEPLPPVLHLDLAAFAEPEAVPLDLEPAPMCDVPFGCTSPTCAACISSDVVEGPGQIGFVDGPDGWQITDSDAPPATLNREFRDVLLAPMYEAMAGHERNAQAKPGPSAVGGCRRKLAHQLLYADEFVAEPSGWAAMKGTVLHAWYDGLCDRPGWFSDLALPASVDSVTGGKLDLYVAPARTIVDLKAPGTTTMKAARAGRLSNGYFTQAQVYGLGAELLGLVVEKVGLLFVPMCGDNLDEAIYWEWPYDRAVAEAALADAERIAADPRPRAEVLASMPTKSDFCSSCPAFGRHCAGALAPAVPVASSSLELVRP